MMTNCNQFVIILIRCRYHSFKTGSLGLKQNLAILAIALKLIYNLILWFSVQYKISEQEI